MNGSTAKIINKAASTYRLKPRRLKRAYNELNHIERGEVKTDMFSFCMELRQADVSIIKSANERRLAYQKQQREKSKKSSGNAIRDLRQKPDSGKSKPPFLRRLVAWMMLKLRIWNFETSYRYERNLEPKKESL